MIENKTFHTGEYHLAHKRELESYLQRRRHEKILKSFYKHSVDLIEDLGWQHPFESEEPKILQMGTANFSTAKTYTDFVHAINPNAKITVADFSKYPLQQCLENGLGDESNVHLARVDTTNLGYTDNSFDLIETDGLLQFLRPDEKKQAVSEWFRVLKPGGIVTTRDRFVSINAKPQAWDELNKIRDNFNNRFGVHTYPTTTEVMRYTFNSQGFSTYIQKASEDPRMILIHEIVARKPQMLKES